MAFRIRENRLNLVLRTAEQFRAPHFATHGSVFWRQTTPDAFSERLMTDSTRMQTHAQIRAKDLPKKIVDTQEGAPLLRDGPLYCQTGEGGP